MLLGSSAPPHAQWNDVIHDVPRPAVRVAGFAFELLLLLRASLDTTVAVALNSCCVPTIVLRGSGIAVRRIVMRGRVGGIVACATGVPVGVTGKAARVARVA